MEKMVGNSGKQDNTSGNELRNTRGKEGGDGIARYEFTSKNRLDGINALQNDEFDLLIIGGGVTGAAIARDATLRGFKVAMVDKDDFSFGTSSRSSKLAHGGFRYIKSLEFGLVRESEAERNWLRNDFPNLVRPLPFIAPSFEGEKYKMPLLWLGVSLYNLLDHYKNFKKGKVVFNPKRISDYETVLDTTGLRGFAVFYDTNIDDARFTVESIKEAVFTGKCTALNYMEVTGLLRDEGGKVCGASVKDNAGAVGKEFDVKAKIVVNATGIWTDNILEKKPAGYPEKVIRPTKGVHVIFKEEDLPVRHAFGIVSHIDGRFFFIIKRDHFVVIGTTDTDYIDDPDKPRCLEEDADYLISTVKLKFPSANLSHDRIIGTYAGVRPLVTPRAKKGDVPSESAVSRDHEIIQSEDDLVSICGGKLTTSRVMAEDLVRKHVLPLAGVKIPGKKFSKKKNIARKTFLISMKETEWNAHPLVNEFKKSVEAGSKRSSLDEERLHHLYQQYGRGGLTILEYARDDPSLLEQVVDGEESKYAPWILAEIKYTILHDCPVHLIDILARRLEFSWMVRPENQIAPVKKVATMAAKLLGWDEEKKKKEISDYLDYLEYNSFFLEKQLER
ncbi:MAG: FAD-dependent oxidoreductase [Promethearchaeota archaeon]